MSLTVCFHRDNSIVSRAIQWQTMGLYSHVSLILPDGRHTESKSGVGVTVRERFTKCANESVDFYKLKEPTSDTELDQGLSFMEEELGCPYDLWALSYFLTRRVPSKASDTKWFCSEYVYAWLRATDRELFRATEPWEVHPSMLSRSPLLVTG